jgi:hypothetical protein
MTDYEVASGSGGRLVIRDTGSVVEFYVQSGSTSTWFDNSHGSYGGSAGSGTFSYPSGAPFKLIASLNVTASNDVTFSIGATGTSGLGGPTSLSVRINRTPPPPPPPTATVPETPTCSEAWGITGTYLAIHFYDGADGGSPVIAREYQYSASPSLTDQTFNGSVSIATPGNGTVERYDLTPGTTYWWRERVANSIGWSSWSIPRWANTLGYPAAPSSSEAWNISGTVTSIHFYDGSNGGAAITAREYQYSASPSLTDQTFNGAISYSLPADNTITRYDLTPGTTYWWRGRVANSVGWSPWSQPRWVNTFGYPEAPISFAPTGITHTDITFSMANSGDGGTPITSRQYAFSASSLFPEGNWAPLAANGSTSFTGLIPGVKYYWRARVLNSVGPSAWSATQSATTLAGAWVNVNGVWKPAVPYVNVNGVWKPAVPYINVNGVWKTPST